LFIKILAGNSNRSLTEAIAAYLGQPLTKCQVRRFADMEIFVEIQENVRGQDVFIVQSTSFPTNDHLMELLIMTDALRRSSARRITAVIPYFGYARQDRKPGPAHADLGQARRQPHHPRRRRPRADGRPARRPDPGLLRHPDRQPLRRRRSWCATSRSINNLDNVMVVSPDVGGVVRARALAKRIDAPLAIVDKRRERAGESEVMNIIGDVGQELHPRRRHRRFRRHAVQRRRRAAGAGRQGCVRLHHPRRAVGRRRRAHLRLEAEGAGHHRHDPADRGDAGRPNIRVITIAPLIGEAIARTAKEESGLEPVRLSRAHSSAKARTCGVRMRSAITSG
jgi:ribose-phosphate pyrophosphokinase